MAGLLTLALGVSASSAAKGKKVESQVEVDGWYWDGDDGDFVVVGDVHAKKPKCEKRRKVTVFEAEGTIEDPPAEGEGEPLGVVRTDATGDWDLNLETDGGDGPNWVTAAVARKKKTTRSGKKLTCKADKASALISD